MTTTATHGATGARIADALRQDILAERYAPGERIRPEKLAEAAGASRLPVREALRMLEGEGLITLVANTGAWVARLSAEEYQELYQMRERLEPLLLRMNVPALSAEKIDDLQRLAEEMARSDDVETFLELDREFHLSCLTAVPTIVLHETAVSLWNRTQHYRRRAARLFYKENAQIVHYDHFLIVNAIRHRDAEEAERVLAGHIRRSRLQLARHPEVFTTP